MRLSVFLVILFTLIFSSISSPSLEAKVIHKERSLYRNIMVTEENGERCLLFTVKKRAKSRQSCQDLSNPKR